jgi:hypothetical protein
MENLRQTEGGSSQRTASVVTAVETHIESFPAKVSHYESQTVTYLDSRLDIK